MTSKQNVITPQQNTTGVITDTMIAEAYRRIRAAELAATEDDRIKPTPQAKARIQAKGLTYSVPEDPKVVVMLDDFQHTVAIPTCDDPTCICHRLEYEQAVAERATKKPRKRTYVAPKPATGTGADKFNNGSQGFSLLR